MDSEDRRTYPRIKIDTPVFIHITSSSGQEYAVLLANISKGGVQLIFSPQFYEPQRLLGQDVTITHFPGKYGTSFMKRKGFVCWVSQQRCGVRFYEPLSLSDENIKKLSHSY